MAELFRRSWAVQVGTIRIEGIGAGEGSERAGLDCSFEVTSSIQREPNKANLKIWNLSPTHRQYIATSENLALRIEAGFIDSRTLLFDGDIRVAASKRRQARHRSPSARLGKVGMVIDDVDIVSEFEAEDGGRAWRTAEVNRSFAANTTVEEVLGYCVDALGVGRGNLSEFSNYMSMRDGDVSTYYEGTVLSGRAHRELDRIVRSVDLTWSVQNGALQLKQRGQALATTAILLSPSTGLEGSPSMGADGYVTALSLLNGTLSPGKPVVLQSKELEGSYSVRRVKHYGDTTAGDWNSEVILEER